MTTCFRLKVFAADARICRYYRDLRDLGVQPGDASLMCVGAVQARPELGHTTITRDRRHQHQQEQHE